MRFLIHLGQLLLSHGNPPLSLDKKTTIVFNPSEFNLLSTYYSLVTQGKIESIAWTDLLRRKFAFSKPPTIKGNPLSAIFKILFIHIFYTNRYNLCRRFTTTDAILSKGHLKDFYVDGPHLMELFQTHYPSFRIRVALTRHQTIRDALISLIASKFRNDLLDCSQGISIFSNFENETLLRAYRSLHPNRKIIIRFCDTIDNQRLPKLRKLISELIADKTIDQAESYFEQNAKSLGITYRPNSVCRESLRSYQCSVCQYLYAFIGVSDANQSRLREFKALKNEILTLYPSIAPFIREVVARRVAHFIPYKDYLGILAASEVVIDLYRRFPKEGFSFRTAEALVLNKKIITNRANILECSFYHPNRFFIIGYDSLNRLQSFLESDCPRLPDSQLELFTTDCIIY